MTERPGKTRGTIEFINPDGMHSNRAFTQLVAVSGSLKTLYIGTQNAGDAAGNIVGKGDIGTQAEQTLKNIEICLAAGGAKPEHLIRWNIYVTQGQPIQPAFEAFVRWWGNRPNPPANTVLVVAGLVPADFLCGIDAIAVVPE